MSSVIFDYLREERERQENTINLIASENYASLDVMRATGSVLTNKYAEGYPGRRYYGGCRIVDKTENYAIEVGKKLFGADHVNVQPHSGSNANFAVYSALLNLGDTVLGMSLAAGGHLTHGHRVSFSGRFYNFVHYGVNQQTECIDYNQIAGLALEHKPKLIVAGASAYSRDIDYKKLSDIAKKVGALLMIDMAHIAGLVAAGVVSNPIPFSDVVTSTTHKTLRGPRGGLICCKAKLAKKIDQSVMPGSQGGPLMHVIAAKAVAFEEASKPSFKEYSKQILKNSQIMATKFQELGYRIISGGTDNHLFLVDLRNAKNNVDLTGKEAEAILEQCNIVVNRNSIPFDPKPPTVTSGIRIGTPAVTTRGFDESHVQQIAIWIDEVIKNRENKQFLQAIKIKVEKLCKQFPIYS